LYSKLRLGGGLKFYTPHTSMKYPAGAAAAAAVAARAGRQAGRQAANLRIP